MADPARLVELAEAIADGRAVDWPSEEGNATPDQLELVRQLRLIAGVASTHRSGDATTTASVGAADVPASWGMLDVHEIIGRGSFGSVYRAWDRRLARQVALKLLHRDHSSAASESVEEGRLLAQVRHPNVITVHGADRFDGRVGIWMDFIDGRTLQEIVADQGPFGGHEAMLIGLDLSSALAAVHRAGLVHGDIKAQNVMREEGGRTVLMDFGAGTDRDSPAGRRAGTPIYMAPEVLAGGQHNASSDIYALGVLLFYLVTGQYPVTGENAAQVQLAHVDSGGRRSLHDLRPDLPAGFMRVVERALARDPQDRFRSAGELHAALSEALQPAKGRGSKALWIAVGLAAALFAVVLWRGALPQSPPTPASIAVLPLVNLTGDPTQDYFAAGLTDVLVANLGSLKGMRIVPVARSGIANDETRRQTLAGLGVGAVLEASVQRTDTRVRVAVRLVQHEATGPGAVIWSRLYEGPVADAYPMQGRIAVDLTRQLGVQPDQRAVAAVTRYAPSQAVQDAYLRGRFLSSTANRDDRMKARGEFEHALTLDPSYAPAHAAIAMLFMSLGAYGVLDPAEMRERATQSAQTAFAIDPTLPEAALAIAEVKFRLEWNWAEADHAYLAAIELNPSYEQARSRYARYLSAAGRTAEALEEARRAYAINPLSDEAYALVGLMMYYAGRYQEAIDFVNARPRGSSSRDRVALGRAYAELGRYPEAIVELEEAVRLSGSDRSIYAELGRVHARAGHEAKAREILAELSARRGGTTEYVAPQDLAYIHAALGESDTALRLLNDAVEEHASRLLWLGVDPRVNSLRSDPRFAALLKRLSIPR